MNDKTIKSMSKIEMVRSEVSGKLLPASECEVVIIKIIKGKNEDINSFNPFAKQEKVTQVVEPGKPTIVEAGPAALDPKSDEYNRMMQIKHSIIPPAMRDIFGKPPELQ